MAKAYSVARVSGLDRALRDSSWRGNRLLILCWHGISLDDEHRWNPGLYVSPARFRERLQALATGKYNVLPLDEALRRLAEGELPPRSVAITFDDGFYDFAVHGAPVLAEFGFPSTVYLATYYVDKQLPVFNLLIQYMLWKSRGPKRQLKDGRPLETASDAGRLSAGITAAIPAGYSSEQRNGIARELAEELDFDLQSVLDRRLLHLLNPAEVRELAMAGAVTFEAHTHRHRTPPDLDLMRKELADNTQRIEEITGRAPLHFCYPSGNYRREFFPLFEEAGLLSATSCELGIASRSAHRFLMPRLLDSDDLTSEQYEGWLSGAYAVGRGHSR